MISWCQHKVTTKREASIFMILTRVIGQKGRHIRATCNIGFDLDNAFLVGVVYDGHPPLRWSPPALFGQHNLRTEEGS